MRATVQLNLGNLATGHGYVGVEATIISEVIDLNVTGKTVSEIAVRIGRPGAGSSVQKLHLGRASGEDMEDTLRALGRALMTHADTLGKITVGTSSDEQEAIASIQKVSQA